MTPPIRLQILERYFRGYIFNFRINRYFYVMMIVRRRGHDPALQPISNCTLNYNLNRKKRTPNTF